MFGQNIAFYFETSEGMSMRLAVDSCIREKQVTDNSWCFIFDLQDMFEDVRQFQELRALTFAMPHAKMAASKARVEKREAASMANGGDGNRGGFYRPWAPDQGNGYIQYDNQLFWDHGWDYDNSAYVNPLAKSTQQRSTDRDGFYGWKM